MNNNELANKLSPRMRIRLFSKKLNMLNMHPQSSATNLNHGKKIFTLFVFFCKWI